MAGGLSYYDTWKLLGLVAIRQAQVSGHLSMHNRSVSNRPQEQTLVPIRQALKSNRSAV